MAAETFYLWVVIALYILSPVCIYHAKVLSLSGVKPLPEKLQFPMYFEGKLFEEIREHRKRRNLTSPYVFCDARGNSLQSVKKSFNSALRKANIKDFIFHDLRHTFASHYLMRGGSLKNFQQILGHKKVKTTMRYAHLSREFQKEEIQIMNGLTKRHGQFLVKSHQNVKLARC